MPEDKPSEGLITRAQLEELASLFDRFEFCLDPLSISAKEAESQFNNQVAEIFRQEIAHRFLSISESLFRSKVRTACRAIIRNSAKNFDALKDELKSP